MTKQKNSLVKAWGVFDKDGNIVWFDEVQGKMPAIFKTRSAARRYNWTRTDAVHKVQIIRA